MGALDDRCKPRQSSKDLRVVEDYEPGYRQKQIRRGVDTAKEQSHLFTNIARRHNPDRRTSAPRGIRDGKAKLEKEIWDLTAQKYSTLDQGLS